MGGDGEVTTWRREAHSEVMEAWLVLLVICLIIFLLFALGGNGRG